MNLIKIFSSFTIYFFLSTLIFASETSEILWRYTTGGRIITAPVEGSEGLLYFGSEDRFLYAIYKDGTLKWRLNLGDRITDTLSLAHDGIIYAGSKRGYFFAVNKFGEQVWKIKLQGSPFGNPAIAPDGSIYLITDEGWLYSISHTGYFRWEVRLPSSPVLGPVLGSDLYISLNNNRLYSYDLNGGMKWMFLLSGQAKSIALAEEAVYVGTDNSTLVSIDLKGSRVWNVSLSGFVNSVLVLNKDRIVCSAGSDILMLDSDSSIIWTTKQRRTLIDLALFSNEIISLDSDGSLNWIDLEGSALGQLKGGEPAGNFLTASDGNIYLGSKDWKYYKYGFKNTISSNYIEYIWPGFGGGIANRMYLNSSIDSRPGPDFLKNSDYIYLMELTRNLNDKTLHELLDELESRLFSRNYDPGNSYLLDILEILASDCVTKPLYEEGILINNFPVIRSRAVAILGITGTYRTIEFLRDLLKYEWDNYVIATIIRSLGKLKSNIDGIIPEALTNYYRSTENDFNTRILNHILISVQEINNYNGIVNFNLITLVTDIFLKSSLRSVKELALDTINSIKK
jgi:outer membrane protein assembly factor BamB